jgi:hypothetical protein
MGEQVIERIVMEQLIMRFIRFYQFHHNNELPTKIVIPEVAEVNGVKVEVASQPKASKKKEVTNAITS